MLPQLEGDIDFELSESLAHDKFNDWHTGRLDELDFQDFFFFLHRSILTNILYFSNMSINSLGFSDVITRRSTSDWPIERAVA
jgi:hypothetical protein